MNTITIMGRLVADIEVQKKEELAYTRFTLASSNRNSKDKTTSFINCVCFGTKAEILSRYVKKGQQVIVYGELQISQYEDSKGKHKKAEVIVDNFEFIATPKNDNQTQAKEKETTTFDFVSDEDLPF